MCMSHFQVVTQTSDSRSSHFKLLLLRRLNIRKSSHCKTLLFQDRHISNSCSFEDLILKIFTLQDLVLSRLSHFRSFTLKQLRVWVSSHFRTIYSKSSDFNAGLLVSRSWLWKFDCRNLKATLYFPSNPNTSPSHKQIPLLRVHTNKSKAIFEPKLIGRLAVRRGVHSLLRDGRKAVCGWERALTVFCGMQGRSRVARVVFVHLGVLSRSRWQSCVMRQR